MESLEHLFKLPPDVQNENLLNLTQVLMIYHFGYMDILSFSLLGRACASMRTNDYMVTDSFSMIASASRGLPIRVRVPWPN